MSSIAETGLLKPGLALPILASLFAPVSLLAQTPDAAQPSAPAAIDPVCAVSAPALPAQVQPPIGERPDGKPIGGGAVLADLPVCPGSGMVMFQKEFSATDKEALGPLLTDQAYKNLAADTSYYRAAWLMRGLNRDPQEVAAMILQASWQADGDPARKRRYQAEYAAAIEPLVTGKDDELSMALAGRAANAHRELGQFEAASALLDTLPLATLAVVVPPEQADDDQAANSAAVRSALAKRNLFAYLTGLKDLVAAHNSASEPLSLMPAAIVEDRCRDATVLSDDDRSYCAGDGVRKIAAAKAQ